MILFTPVGQARELAAVTLRLAAEAIADGDTRLAAAILDQAQPESADGSAATIAGCIGVALGLLDGGLCAARLVAVVVDGTGGDDRADDSDRDRAAGAGVTRSLCRARNCGGPCGKPG